MEMIYEEEQEIDQILTESYHKSLLKNRSNVNSVQDIFIKSRKPTSS